MKGRKKYAAPLAAIAVVLMALSGCGGASGSGGSQGRAVGNYVPVAADIAGEVTIMMWSGDGSFMQDIGHKNYAPEEILGQNQAAAYAVAKEFNKIYPNVKINIYAKTGDPNADGIRWAQHRENFAMEYGVSPDLYAATDLPGDVEKGLVADISVFSDDPMYQTFNKSVMAMMSIGGKQFGLPQYLLPWGIFVNKSLADANNIDIPDPDWTIDEYTAFTAHSQTDTYYGAMDAVLDLLKTGNKDFAYSLLYRKDTDPYVNFNSPAMRKLLEYIPVWAQNAVHPQNDLGKVSPEFMAAGDWWSYNFFKNGKLLTLAGDPWMMGDAANPTPGHWGAAQFADWDIYPRPSNEFVGNHIGVVLDPFAIRNYAMDDGNPELSAEEKTKLQIAYEFAKFWCGDTRSWQARADQQFFDQGNLKTCMNDSFPLVTGDEFDKQMQIWYTPETHRRFADKTRMPGFQKVLQLWEDGQFWDISDKAYPWYYEFEGSTRDIVWEWLNCWNVEVTGATRTDANWLDQMYSHLADWNAQFNARWADKFVAIQQGLATYYK
jgi:maltose-binding protein MalE